MMMLPKQELQPAINKLVKGKSDLIFYGNKSSGKTTLSKKVLNQCLGTNNYIEVDGIFAISRDAFLFLVGDSLFRLLKSLDSRFAYLFEDQKPKFIEEGIHLSLQLWLKSLKKFMKSHEDFFIKLPRIYIFIDNIEQLSLSEQFIKSFYFALKREIKYLQVSFFFCGMCHKSTLFTIHQPFRNIPIFIMPQPFIRIIIQGAILDSELNTRLLAAKNKLNQFNKNKKYQYQQEKYYVNSFQSLLKHIQRNFYNSFESLQYQIQNTYLLAKCFLQQVYLYVANDPKKAVLWMSKQNADQQKQLLKKLQNYGPVTLERTSYESTKKSIGIQQNQQGQATFYLQNYPNLIMASLGLANGYPQTEDVKRFIDLKKTRNIKSTSNKNMSKRMADRNFKQDLKKIRHNYQRIIAISQVLEDQSSGYRLHERQLQHHTLDYYGCIEYLREEGSLSFYGKNSGKYGGKIYGHPKQSQVKDFMNKIGLQYSQFTDRD